MQSVNFEEAPAKEKPLWLKHVIDSQKSKAGVKLLAAILLYEDRNNLPLVDVCRTRHDINNGVDNYLDFNTGIWMMNTCTIPKTITISKELLSIINSGKGDTWIYGDGTNKTNNLVIAFKTLFGVSYLEVNRQLNPKLKPKVKAEVKREVEPEVAVEPIAEPVASQVSAGTVRASSYNWEYFDKGKSDKIHIHRIKALMFALVGDDQRFYHSIVDCDEGLIKVKCIIDKMSSLNTQANTTNSLCKFLELAMSSHYMQYSMLKDQISLQLKEHNAMRSVIPYTEITQRLDSAMKNNQVAWDVKIMVKLLQCISNYTEMTCGALRFSDVANTRLTDNGDHHFLDLQNRVWHLRKNHTKNKTDRTAIISDEFADFITSLNLESDKPLICPNGKTDGISKRFLKNVGVNYTDARASYVTYLDSVCDDVETISTICKNQGHKLQTALESYRRSKTEPVAEQ
jgi:hypothetical protein